MAAAIRQRHYGICAHAQLVVPKLKFAIVPAGSGSCKSLGALFLRCACLGGRYTDVPENTHVDLNTTKDLLPVAWLAVHRHAALGIGKPHLGPGSAQTGGKF